MRASALCRDGLLARSLLTSPLSCGSLNAFHQSPAGWGAGSAERPRVWDAISVWEGVVGGASTQPTSGSARNSAAAWLLFNLIPGITRRPASPDSPFLEVTERGARSQPGLLRRKGFSVVR